MPDEVTPTRIKRLGVKGFRCIKKLDLELPPFTVVIGPNGAGKSTLLGCFELLHRLARSELKTAFTEYGGFNAALNWLSKDDDMALEVTVGDDAVDLRYSADLVAAGNAHYVAAEQLESIPLPGKDKPDSQKRYVLPRVALVQQAELTSGRGYILRTGEDFPGEWCSDDGGVISPDLLLGSIFATPEIQQNPPGKRLEALLGRAGENNREARRLVATLGRTSFWSASELTLERKVWASQELGPSSQLLPDGSNIFSVLYSMKAERRELYKEFVENIQVAIPEFESIEFPLVGRGFATMDWRLKGVPHPVSPRQLSDGTLRLLWLVTILLTAPDDGLVLIDEPETSLHPQWLMILVSLLRQTSARTQVIVATHSDQLIRWLEPHELLVADIEDGVSRFRWGSDMNLDEWLDEYTLDRLWHMGELGGRQ